MTAHLDLERDFKDLYNLTDVLVSQALPCHIMVLMGQQRNIKAACDPCVVINAETCASAGTVDMR